MFDGVFGAYENTYDGNQDTNFAGQVVSDKFFKTGLGADGSGNHNWCRFT
jgi:hypothetical protein